MKSHSLNPILTAVSANCRENQCLTTTAEGFSAVSNASNKDDPLVCVAAISDADGKFAGKACDGEKPSSSPCSSAFTETEFPKMTPDVIVGSDGRCCLASSVVVPRHEEEQRILLQRDPRIDASNLRPPRAASPSQFMNGTPARRTRPLTNSEGTIDSSGTMHQAQRSALSRQRVPWPVNPSTNEQLEEQSQVEINADVATTIPTDQPIASSQAPVGEAQPPQDIATREDSERAGTTSREESVSRHSQISFEQNGFEPYDDPHDVPLILADKSFPAPSQLGDLTNRLLVDNVALLVPQVLYILASRVGFVMLRMWIRGEERFEERPLEGPTWNRLEALAHEMDQAIFQVAIRLGIRQEDYINTLNLITAFFRRDATNGVQQRKWHPQSWARELIDTLNLGDINKPKKRKRAVRNGFGRHTPGPLPCHLVTQKQVQEEWDEVFSYMREEIDSDVIITAVEPGKERKISMDQNELKYRKAQYRQPIQQQLKLKLDSTPLLSMLDKRECLAGNQRDPRLLHLGNRLTAASAYEQAENFSVISNTTNINGHVISAFLLPHAEAKLAGKCRSGEKPNSQSNTTFTETESPRRTSEVVASSYGRCHLASSLAVPRHAEERRIFLEDRASLITEQFATWKSISNLVGNWTTRNLRHCQFCLYVASLVPTKRDVPLTDFRLTRIASLCAAELVTAFAKIVESTVKLKHSFCQHDGTISTDTLSGIRGRCSVVLCFEPVDSADETVCIKGYCSNRWGAVASAISNSFVGSLSLSAPVTTSLSTTGSASADLHYNQHTQFKVVESEAATQVAMEADTLPTVVEFNSGLRINRNIRCPTVALESSGSKTTCVSKAESANSNSAADAGCYTASGSISASTSFLVTDRLVSGADGISSQANNSKTSSDTSTTFISADKEYMIVTSEGPDAQPGLAEENGHAEKEAGDSADRASESEYAAGDISLTEMCDECGLPSRWDCDQPDATTLNQLDGMLCSCKDDDPDEARSSDCVIIETSREHKFVSNESSLDCPLADAPLLSNTANLSLRGTQQSDFPQKEPNISVDSLVSRQTVSSHDAPCRDSEVIKCIAPIDVPGATKNVCLPLSPEFDNGNCDAAKERELVAGNSTLSIQSSNHAQHSTSVEFPDSFDYIPSQSAINAVISSLSNRSTERLFSMASSGPVMHHVENQSKSFPPVTNSVDDTHEHGDNGESDIHVVAEYGASGSHINDGLSGSRNKICENIYHEGHNSQDSHDASLSDNSIANCSSLSSLSSNKVEQQVGLQLGPLKAVAVAVKAFIKTLHWEEVSRSCQIPANKTFFHFMIYVNRFLIQASPSFADLVAHSELIMTAFSSVVGTDVQLSYVSESGLCNDIVRLCIRFICQEPDQMDYNVKRCGGNNDEAAANCIIAAQEKFNAANCKDALKKILKTNFDNDNEADEQEDSLEGLSDINNWSPTADEDEGSFNFLPSCHDKMETCSTDGVNNVLRDDAYEWFQDVAESIKHRSGFGVLRHEFNTMALYRFYCYLFQIERCHFGFGRTQMIRAFCDEIVRAFILKGTSHTTKAVLSVGSPRQKPSTDASTEDCEEYEARLNFFDTCGRIDDLFGRGRTMYEAKCSLITRAFSVKDCLWKIGQFDDIVGPSAQSQQIAGIPGSLGNGDETESRKAMPWWRTISGNNLLDRLINFLAIRGFSLTDEEPFVIESLPFTRSSLKQALEDFISRYKDSCLTKPLLCCSKIGLVYRVSLFLPGSDNNEKCLSFEGCGISSAAAFRYLTAAVFKSHGAALISRGPMNLDSMNHGGGNNPGGLNVFNGSVASASTVHQNEPDFGESSYARRMSRPVEADNLGVPNENDWDASVADSASSIALYNWKLCASKRGARKAAKHAHRSIGSVDENIDIHSEPSVRCVDQDDVIWVSTEAQRLTSGPDIACSNVSGRMEPELTNMQDTTWEEHNSEQRIFIDEPQQPGRFMERDVVTRSECHDKNGQSGSGKNMEVRTKGIKLAVQECVEAARDVIGMYSTTKSLRRAGDSMIAVPFARLTLPFMQFRLYVDALCKLRPQIPLEELVRKNLRTLLDSFVSLIRYSVHFVLYSEEAVMADNGVCFADSSPRSATFGAGTWTSILWFYDLGRLSDYPTGSFFEATGYVKREVAYAVVMKALYLDRNYLLPLMNVTLLNEQESGSLKTFMGNNAVGKELLHSRCLHVFVSAARQYGLNPRLGARSGIFLSEKGRRNVHYGWFTYYLFLVLNCVDELIPTEDVFLAWGRTILEAFAVVVNADGDFVKLHEFETPGQFFIRVDFSSKRKVVMRGRGTTLKSAISDLLTQVTNVMLQCGFGTTGGHGNTIVQSQTSLSLTRDSDNAYRATCKNQFNGPTSNTSPSFTSPPQDVRHVFGR